MACTARGFAFALAFVLSAPCADAKSAIVEAFDLELHQAAPARLTDRLAQPEGVAWVGRGLIDGFPYVSPYADPAQFQAPALPNLESTVATPTPAAVGGQRSFASLGAFGSGGGAPGGQDVAFGGAAGFSASTDTADLLGESPSVLSLGVQRRSPIVTDPRVRGVRVGSLAASGSYWRPARIDLDTALSKIDSRLVDRIAVTPGPYTALHGPGFEFIDVDLVRSPRYQNGFETHGSTLLDYKANGQQVNGRQSVWGGDQVWGFRADYGHRTGNDYTAADGTRVPSSYKSRDAFLSVGAQLTDSTSGEFQYLRVDQTDVELPGQAFDIDFLATNGYEVFLAMEDRGWCDLLEVTAWRNDTRLEGSAQRPGKRATIPFFDLIDYVGFTDIRSSSTGYVLAASWGGGDSCDPTLTAGTDLRYVDQELNEFSTSTLSPAVSTNSPIPESHTANPGLFFEVASAADADTRVRLGGRADWASSDIDADPAELEDLTPLRRSAADLLGSGEFRQDELLVLGFLSIDRPITDSWDAGLSIGYSERAPNLTERYAVQPFMFLLQSGLNTVTGDPELDKERRFQIDLRLGYEKDYFRSQVALFHTWAYDYITFENFNTVFAIPQVQLKYVNTDRVNLQGFESRTEVDLTQSVTAFATVNYVEAEDRSRDGSFATLPVSAGSTAPSMRIPGIERGSFSGVNPTPMGGASNLEPLPSILPLEGRVGLMIEQPCDDPRWGLEVSARLVDAQNRVAGSLLESTTPGFVVGDLRGYLRPSDNLYLASGVENFTDTRYREHLDFRAIDQSVRVPQPGVGFYLSAELTY